MSDYTRTAQALAHTIDSASDDEPPPRRSSHPRSPTFTRRSLSSNRSRSRPSPTSRFFQSSTMDSYYTTAQSLISRFNKLRLLHRVLLVVGGAVMLVLGILFLVFNEKIFGALAPVAKKWRGMRGGWCILWAATFVVGFPPLIGYSSCVTLAGFVFGVPQGWLIAASATVIGSTASFVVSRTVLKSYVERLTQNDKRFAALALTLKHDGLKLLIMIRLCPLPYSLSNGAMSTIPTVTIPQFMLASIIASPKLILHVFVGSRLGAIAESGDKMDAKTKAISYLSIAIGVCAGAATGWFMYTKTKARAAELEAEEREAAIRVEEGEGGFVVDEDEYQYSDDPVEREAAETLGRKDDEISLHDARQEGDRQGAYRDSFSSVENAEELEDDPFGDGFGETTDEEGKPRKGKK